MIAEGVLVMGKVDDLDLVLLHGPALLAIMEWMKVLMDARVGVATIAEMHVRLRAVLLPDDVALGHGRVRGPIDLKACVHLIFIYFYMYVLFCFVRLLYTKLPGLVGAVSDYYVS
ncbi:hypothetical protein EG68_02362 [Paragonimus skrjabini miyazakii]|uniref:Uncharacterized protein n=1 Tax=Paragonimus skrjabini miyazakii TaxID=59628 RepID=A0A8S9Z363_9TREM|nr:hypothetical protein EG68_02362 [Paragonimus skrjabini miyazakii]